MSKEVAFESVVQDVLFDNELHGLAQYLRGLHADGSIGDEEVRQFVDRDFGHLIDEYDAAFDTAFDVLANTTSFVLDLDEVTFQVYPQVKIQKSEGELVLALTGRNPIDKDARKAIRKVLKLAEKILPSVKNGRLTANAAIYLISMVKVLEEASR
jgi:hypothetical protein